MVKCEVCGKDMDFCKNLENDWNSEDMVITVIDQWECLDCQIVEIVAVKGRIEEVEKYVR